MKAETPEGIESKNPRIMIYPSSRVLKSEEIQIVSERINDFLSDWTTHGEPLLASFRIERNQFLIIFIDEENAKADGCSVDSLTSMIRDIDTEFGLDFLNRMKVSYIENGETKTINLLDFKKGIKNSSIPQNIEVFDFSKETYSDYLSGFLLPLEKSWAKIYL